MAKKPVNPNAPKIWCLFSVDQNYDQPNNNLVAWWTEKPILEVLFSTLNVTMGERDDTTVAVVKVWSGENVVVGFGTHYRLEHVSEGKLDE